MFDLSGKTALVTGASYGLGEGFALAFAEAGADLVLTARSADLLEVVAERCRESGVMVTTVAGDVSVEDDVARVVGTGIDAHGSIDVLVNNAGVSDLRGVAPERFDMDTWNRILAVDLNGAGALRNLTLQLGCEWADRGVRVNSVSPGFIVTEMTRPALDGLGMTTWIASRTPMRRVGELDEIVAPVLFLASDAAGYITGHDLCVDGGTNAANGYYQIPPIHHEWNADTAPRVAGGYDGVVPRPGDYQALAAGIPGVHFPAPS